MNLKVIELTVTPVPMTSGLKQQSEAELVMASNPVGEVPITGTGGVPTTSVTATSTSDSTTGENLTQSQSTISGKGTLKQKSEAELVMASNPVGEVPISGTGGVPPTSITATSSSDSATGTGDRVATTTSTATGENLTQSQSTVPGIGTGQSYCVRFVGV